MASRHIVGKIKKNTYLFAENYTPMLATLHRLATGRNVLILLALDAVMMFGVMGAMSKWLQSAVGPGDARPLDLMIPTYSPRAAHTQLTFFGDEGREVYKTIELTADMIYPLVYGFAFALLIAFLWKRLVPQAGWVYWLPLLPLIGMLFDYAENMAIVSLINSFPAPALGMARLAGAFTLLKWLFAFAGIGAIAAGLVGWLYQRFSGGRAAPAA